MENDSENYLDECCETKYFLGFDLDSIKVENAVISSREDGLDECCVEDWFLSQSMSDF